jgi:hypothetical protein
MKLSRRQMLMLAAAAPAGAANPASPLGLQFEPEPLALADGRSPRVVARRAHGLLLIYTAAAAQGGADLLFCSSSDLGETWTEPQRVNSQPGEVSDHGENSPQLLLSPDEMTMYAVWNARDPQAPMGSHVRFSRAGSMNPVWSPAITLNDDGLPVSHSFQGAAVGPDGTIYAAWLDGRERESGGGQDKGYTGGSSALYLARSTDGGRTFGKNQRIAGDVCPCCRVAFGFSAGRAVVSWRGVQSGDIRDIHVASSGDSGATWTAGSRVAEDNWKIKGCPHVGASLAALNGRLWLAWYSEGAGKPGIFLASSQDGGQTFGPRRLVSEGTTDPTHPELTAAEDRLAVVFQARSAAARAGFGKTGIYYREFTPSGVPGRLIRFEPSVATPNYPHVALGMSGRAFVTWTETVAGKPKALLVRGRPRSAAS